jgi:hypothetical protein
MKSRVAALILSIIVAFAPQTQTMPACVSSDGSNIPADLATAQVGSRCLEIPQGTYTISPTSGEWLNVIADGMELRGAGMGKTIIQTTGITLTSSLYLIQLRGKNQHVSDLTIQIGSGYTGNYEIGGVRAYVEAEHSLIERVEVSGGYSGNGSNGFGIGTSRLFSTNQAAQHVTIRDCYVHDSPTTGIGINSSNNLILHNRIKNVGTTGLHHGFYAQGGGNLYEGNVIENASGYSFHGHKQVPSLDGSGDRYIGNLSLNPGTGHIVINSTTNGSNPLVPTGAALTRNATISDNTFRNTAGKRSGGIWCNGVACSISGNSLEDTFVTNGAGWIEDSGGSIITGNLLTTSGTAPDGAVNYSLIRVTGTAGATVANNKLTNAHYGRGIVASGARHSITGNTVLQVGTPQTDALLLSGDMLLVTGNRLESTGGGYTVAVQAPLTNLTFSGNYLKRAGDLCNLTLTGVTGRIFNNQFDGTFRYSGAAPGLIQ